ncbi:MAG: ATP-grasp domain-containing protein [Clostridium sp.]
MDRKQVNVLILSVGRRVELVECFKKAAKRLGVESNVVGADLTTTAPALYFCDKKREIPRIGTDSYLSSIIDICNDENISLIVPTIDTELMILSENKAYIESNTNAKVLVSDESVINICRNKVNSNRFFEENGFGVPKEITEEDIVNKRYSFPLFIKPFNGSSSINTFKVNNDTELEFFRNYVNEPLIQEFVEGVEYTIDVLLDFDSNPITIVPRQRLATRSGEISKGLIIKDEDVINEVKKVLAVLKPIGHITVQCMKTAQGIKFIEINPRFGGGAPMSIKVGADSPYNLYKLILGEKLSYNDDFENNVLAIRYDEAIYVNSKGELI